MIHPEKVTFLMLLLFGLMITSCKEPLGQPDPLQEIIAEAPPFIREMIDSSEYEIQIIYTQIERDEENRVSPGDNMDIVGQVKIFHPFLQFIK